MPTRLLIGTLTLIVALGVHADERDDDDNDGSRFRLAVGAGAMVEQSPYVGGKDSVEILPLTTAWAPTTCGQTAPSTSPVRG